MSLGLQNFPVIGGDGSSFQGNNVSRMNDENRSIHRISDRELTDNNVSVAGNR